MNLKVLMGILFYFALLSIIYWGGVDTLTGFTTTSNLSSFDTTNESATPSVFQTAGSFGRFWLFLSFGVGLPATTPLWFQFMFTTWFIVVDIFLIGFIISSIWNG